MTSSSDSSRFSCPACGKRYRFKPEYAGRKVKCACGQVMRMPENPGESAVGIGSPPSWSSADSSIAASYEMSHSSAAGLTPPSAPASNPGRCPNCGGHVKTAAVICINCGYNLRTGKKVATIADDEPDSSPPVAEVLTQTMDQVTLANKTRQAQADVQAQVKIIQQYRWRDIQLPVILLVAGLGLTLLNALVLGPLALSGTFSSSSSLGLSVNLLSYAGIHFAIQMPLLLVAIFIVARLFGSNYGTLGIALLKLAALALLVSGANDSVIHLLNLITGGFAFIGFILQITITYGLFYLLCLILFEMDFLETTVLYVLMFLLPLVAMFLGKTIMLSIWP